jgi:ABC-type transporter Mla maintaining outer membrane lipid asymmetry permease subunit MlaE
MEAGALRDGARLAADLGLQRIQLETDSMEVINLWKNSCTRRSIIASIVNELLMFVLTELIRRGGYVCVTFVVGNDTLPCINYVFI